nr:putative inorganic phosphate cotransporter [Leptinotarsa decemlineata]
MAVAEEQEVNMYPKERLNGEIQNGHQETTVTEESQFLDIEPTRMNKGPKFGKRHEQVLCNFFLTFIAYSVRVSMSVAIVAMTNPSTSANRNIPTFNWTDKSIVLSSFFWGYVIPQVGAGWLAGQYGPKWFLVGSMAICSISGCFLPMSAVHFGSKGVMACRAVQGLCQGFIYPSIHSILAKWVPHNERSFLANLLYSGGPSGSVVSMIMTGYLSESSYGWPMIFYILNGLGIVWCAVFSYVGCNSPADHTTITEEERKYIEGSSGSTEKKGVS